MRRKLHITHLTHLHYIYSMSEGTIVGSTRTALWPQTWEQRLEGKLLKVTHTQTWHPDHVACIALLRTSFIKNKKCLKRCLYWTFKKQTVESEIFLPSFRFVEGQKGKSPMSVPYQRVLYTDTQYSVYPNINSYAKHDPNRMLDEAHLKVR